MMLKGDAARSKTGSNGVKRSLENNNENGTDEEGWDQVSKRLKTELTYMKGKEKKVGRADITVASVEKLRVRFFETGSSYDYLADIGPEEAKTSQGTGG